MLLCLQLCLLEHEGKWQRALLSYDLAQTYTSPGNLQQVVPRESPLGLVQCLRHIGCNTLLESCLESSKYQGGKIWQEEYNDVRHELAWKMGHWDSVADQLGKQRRAQAGEGNKLRALQYQIGVLCVCSNSIVKLDNPT